MIEFSSCLSSLVFDSTRAGRGFLFQESLSSQIFAFRDEALLLPKSCPVTGEQLSRCKAAVDHEPPNTFEPLVFALCTEHHINLLKVQVGSESGVLPVFEDQNPLQLWRSLHQDRATLHLVSRLKISDCQSHGLTGPSSGHECGDA